VSRVLINALASTAGGGQTYLRNVLPRLSRFDTDNRYLVLAPAANLPEYRALVGEDIDVETAPVNGGVLPRLWWEQSGLRRYLSRQKIDLLICLGNFSLMASPVPQILFNRNDLYFSEAFENDLYKRRLYGDLVANRLKSWLAQASIRQAEVNVVPTRAFGDHIRRSLGRATPEFEVMPFGFDPAIFNASGELLDASQLAALKLDEPLFRILLVSHYNYFRNFETVIKALPLVKTEADQRGLGIQLVLTTDLQKGAVYGGYDATSASDLIDELGIRQEIAMLGSVSYTRLHDLYRRCDAAVCPSYAESFGHPLVEAMASGLPVIAADLDVHREVCGEAAVYFGMFDDRDLAAQILGMMRDRDLQKQLIERGSSRFKQFSWDDHVKRLTALVGKSLARAEAPARADARPDARVDARFDK
jgi:glycosyltransferase involved in cell wall biosynthesis